MLSARLAQSPQLVPAGEELPLASTYLEQDIRGEESPWLALGQAVSLAPERWLDAAHVTDVSIPQIKLIFPRDWGSGDHRPALCVFPGGGYSCEALYKEGVEVARWAAQRGKVGLVLKYRVAEEASQLGVFPGPLLDARQVIVLLRQHAGRLGVDAGRVGVMGFSAGAHLAAMAATLWNRTLPVMELLENVSWRPDVALLIYPVVSMQPGITHTDTRCRILGCAPDARLERLCSAEMNVTPETPPLFLVQALDDVVSPLNSERIEHACLQAGVPVRRVTYSHGGHGYGMERRGNPTDAWPQEAEAWLREQGMLP